MRFAPINSRPVWYGNIYIPVQECPTFCLFSLFRDFELDFVIRRLVQTTFWYISICLQLFRKY